MILITLSSPCEAIVGGEGFSEREMPPLFRLTVWSQSVRRYFNCTTSYISVGWVLTSASCLDGRRVKHLHYANMKFDRLKLFQYTNSSGDLALINFHDGVSEMEFLSLPLPNEDDEIMNSGQKTQLMAGGQTVVVDRAEQSVTSSWRWLNVRPTEETCETEGTIVGSNELCSVTKKFHPYFICSGDTGAPVVFEFIEKTVIIAILSSGTDLCLSTDQVRPKIVTIYTLLSPYVPWILHQIDVVNDYHDEHILEIMESWSLHHTGVDFPDIFHDL